MALPAQQPVRRAMPPTAARTAARTAAPGVRQRPVLTVVRPQRRAVRWVAVLSVAVVAAMLGAAAFQTYLAKGQLELDRLDRQIVQTAADYQVLRETRAELLSPGRLTEFAAKAAMVPAADVQFMTITADTEAVVRQSTGELNPTFAAESSLLEQFRTVKALREVRP